MAEMMPEMPLAGTLPEGDGNAVPEAVERPLDRPAIAEEFREEEVREAATLRALTDFNYWLDWRVTYMQPVWQACHNAYEGKAPRNPAPYRSVVVIQESFRHMETIKPLMYKMFLGEENFEYVARHPGHDDEMAGATAIVRQHRQRFGLLEEERRWVDSALHWGVGILHTGWRRFRYTSFKKRVMWDQEQHDSWWETQSDEQTQDGPFAQALNPWNVVCHPLMEDLRSSPYVFHHELSSAAALKTLVREGWLDRAAVIEAAKTIASASGRMIQQYVAPGNTDLDLIRLFAPNDWPLSLITCWTNDGWEFAWLGDPGRATMCRAQRVKSGTMPLYALRNYPQFQKFYGQPELLHLLDEQHALNDFMGMLMDGMHLSVNPMVKISADMQDSWYKMAFRPGGALLMTAGGQCEPLQLNSEVVRVAPVLIDWIRGNQRATSGTTNELSGLESARRPATVYRGTLEQASSRMAGKAAVWMPEYKRYLRSLYSLEAEHLDETQVVRMAGQPGKSLWQSFRPDIFSAEMDVDVKLENEFPPGPEEAGKWQQLYAAAAADPLLDRAKVLERWVGALGEPKPKIFLVNPALTQSQALQENQDALAFGSVRDEPKAGEDHQGHMMLHFPWQQMLKSGQVQAHPGAVPALAKHMMIHMDYMQAMEKTQGAAAGAASQQSAPGGGTPQDALTEAEFENARAGAAVQGAVPR